MRSLLHCLSQETDHNAWICALINQLQKDLGDDDLNEVELLTPKCLSHLKDLCRRFKDGQDEGGWNLYLNEYETDKLLTDDERDSFQKKRKNENSDHLNMEASGPLSKRRKTELVDLYETKVVIALDDEGSDVGTLQTDKAREAGSPGMQLASQKGCMSSLPDHIKVSL